jgi:hypothetical protein
LTGRISGSNRFLRVYRNDNGSFTDIGAGLQAIAFSYATWGDYDNDGDLDILACGLGSSGSYTLLYSNNSGSFSSVSHSLENVNSGSIEWGDYDSDGDLDILITGDINNSGTGVTKVYRNDSGSFTSAATLKPLRQNMAKWGDYDNDGDLDILFAGYGSDSGSDIVTLVYNNDNGSFSDISAGLTGITSDGYVTWGDYDNDGDLDIVATGYKLGSPDGTVKLYRNNASTSNSVPTAPSSLSSSVNASRIVTLSWSKSTDNKTSQNGLTYNLRIGTTSGGSEIMSPMSNASTGYRRVVRRGNVDHNVSWKINGLSPGTYYWSVQAVDNAFSGSAFATEKTFTISNATISVKPDGTKDQTTIQAAINAAFTGDTILVYAGTYTENIDYGGKNLVIQSVDGPESTILKPYNNNVAIVWFKTAETSAAKLIGFKLTDGGSVRGSALKLSQSHPTIENCIITNSAGDYSPVAFYYSAATLTNCLIYNNTSKGLYFDVSSYTPSIINCTIYNNEGTGIYATTNNAPVIKNSIIYSNDTNVSGSFSITYSLVQGGHVGTGNIDSDPFFVNASGGDYSLQNYSPAIGAGTTTGAPSADINGNTRPTPSGTNPDMGAYENSLGSPAIEVMNVTSTTDNGTYKIGDVVAITITFSEAVTVTGTPQLTLETGSTDAVVNYSTGSATNTLTFNYTVASGHTSSDLDYKNTTALALNGGTIKDSDGNVATLTLPTPGAAGSLGANKALVVDGVAPTVSGVTSTTANGTYKVGDAISIIVGLSDVVTVTGAPRIQLETGTTDQYASYASGTGNDTLTFTYTVASGDTTSDLDYTSTSALELNSGTIKDAAGNTATLTLASPGASGSLGANKAIVIDGNAPTVSSVSSTKANGGYTVGDTIPITITFTQTVTVTGTPYLTLALDNINAAAAFFAGSGSSILTFNYIVASGHTSGDLDYGSTNALELDSGTIKDASGNDATSTLPERGATNSLGANKALIIDTTSPTVSTVSSTKADAAYKTGEVIPINVVFDDKVYVTGTPQLTLETGTTDAVVDYSSGSESTTLTFNYTVASTHNSSDLDYTSTSALALNSGTLKDSLGNVATLTLPEPGATGSLGANKAIIIDNLPPTLTLDPADGSTAVLPTLAISIAFNEYVRLTDNSEATSTNVDALITLKDTDASGTDISFDATINSTKTVITIGTIDGFASEQTVYVAISASLEDSLDHGTSAASATLKMKDVIVPTVTFDPTNGSSDIPGNRNITLTFSEPIRTIDNSEITALNVAGLIVLKGNNASGADFNFGATINADKTVITVDPLFDFSASSVVYVGIGAVVEDDADNAIAASSATFTIGVPDIIGPKVLSVNSENADSAYTTGDTIIIGITFDEIAIVTGTPQLTLETGGSDDVVDYSSGTGTATLTFNYIIGGAQKTDDLDYSSTSALALNGGSIKDASGNAATLTLPTPGGAGSLGANKAILVKGAYATSVSSTSSDGTYKIGDLIPIIVAFDQNVSVTGTPSIKLETGTTDQYADSTSENVINDTLVFSYTVVSGDTTADLDYTSTSALELNNGTIKDPAGNAATLTLASPGATNSLGANKAIVIDGNMPTVSSVSSTKANGAYTVGDTIPITITFNQTVTIKVGNTAVEPLPGTDGSPYIYLPQIPRDVFYTSGSGTNILRFDYIIAAGENTSDLSYTTTNKLAIWGTGGSIQDASGNDALLTLPTSGQTGSLSANKNIIIDTAGPTVLSVNSTTVDSAYNAGDTVIVSVTFNDKTVITRTPQITMETGLTDGTANYTSGSGTTILLFNYIIASTHNIIDLDYTSTSALILNDGTVKDAVGNNASLTLPAPGATNSLGANKSIIIDNIAPVITMVAEGYINGEDTDYQASSTTMSLSWSGSDTLSGIINNEYSIGTTSGGIETISWTSSSNDTSLSVTNLSLSDATKYYISARATDKAGNVSAVKTGDGITIDLTKPSVGTVSDDTDGDISFTASSTTLYAQWTGFKDATSGITDYEYAVGTTSAGTNTKDWSSNGMDTTVTVTILTLTNGQTYHMSVRAKDLVGNVSNVITTNGVTADLVGPTKGTVMDGLTADAEWINTDTIRASWTGFTDPLSGMKKYQYCIGKSEGASDVVDWTDNSLDTTITLKLTVEEAVTYYVSVRGVDKVDNIGEAATSDGITADFTPPTIVSASIEDNATLPILSDSEIIFTISEPITAATSTTESKLGDSAIGTLTLDDATQISVKLANPFTSGDELTLTINDLKDHSGNVTSNLVYNYNIALIADYNVDGSIDAADLTVLINGWTNKDYAYELGPAAGDVPNLKPSTDGKYDIMDAAVLIRMWHWNLNKSGKMLSRYINLGKELAYINENNTLSIQVSKDVNAVDFYFDYPQHKVSIKQSQESSSDKEIILSHLDTLNGKFLITAGYLEQKLQSIEVPYIINGREDVTITAIYRMFNTNGEVISQGTKEITLKPVPQEFALHQNYPNPFNPVTTINYDLPQQTHVNLMIYDILGREVVKLISEETPEGYQSVIWNTRNNFGQRVSAGIYFYQIQTKGFVKTRKMVLLK